MITRKLLLTAAILIFSVSFAAGQYSYWFDCADKASPQAVFTGGAQLDIDASSLPEGRHTVHVRYVDSNGQASLVSRDFLRIKSPDGLTPRFYIDGIPAVVDGQDGAAAGSFHFEFDASELSIGLHTVAVQFTGEDGVIPTDIAEGLFLRVPEKSETDGMTCFYTIDNDPSGYSVGSIVNGLLHADIDVAALADGLHSIRFLLAGKPPVTTQAFSAYFVKIPQGGIGIKNYSYWINDDIDNQASFNLENPETPASIMSLFPVREYAFRSTDYHFAVEDEKPVIYPLNHFNMLVSDNRGYLNVSSSPFHDTRQKIDSAIDTISPGIAKMTGPFKDNEIKIYSFTAQYGDSLILGTDRNASVDLYDNSGSLLFASRGIDIVNGAGTHTRSDGTHYAVIHDVSQNLPTNLRLDRIDRFALLEHTPSRHANEGLMIMSLAGNGFESLRKVWLSKGDIVVGCDSVVTTGHSRAKALFDFGFDSMATCGTYDLGLVFNADDKTDTIVVPDALVLEPLQYVEPKVEVSLKQAVRQLPHTLSVSVTNLSNTSLWAVPFNVAYDNLDVELYRRFVVAGVPESAGKKEPLYYDTDNLLGKGVEGRYMPLYIPWLEPGETKTLTFALKSTDKKMNFYAWCGLPLSQEVKRFLSVSETEKAPVKIRESNFNYNRLSDFQSTANEVGGSVGGGGGNAITAGNIGISIGCTLGGIVLAGGNNSFNAWRDAYPGLLDDDDLPYTNIPHGMTPGAILNGAGILPGAFGDALDNSLRPRNQNNAENDNPNPTPYPLDIPRPCDPNEMRGYVAPSGSNHIGLDVARIDYTIEFENEPEVATAPASYIRIENKLDSKLFDTGTFRARSLSIGSRTVELADGASGVVTVDMRPEINSIASAEWNISEDGSLVVEINTLDPLTMDIAENPWNGVLPVNYDGSGIGEFEYEIGLQTNLPDSTRIANSARIVFNTENPIATDSWVNTTDYSRPTARMRTVRTADNLNFEFEAESSDAGSGIWYRKLYGQRAGELSWNLLLDGIDSDKFVYTADKVEADMYYSVLAVDKAGNIQDDSILRKVMGDADSNRKVDASDTVMLVEVSLGNKAQYDAEVADINGDGRIDVQDVVTCAYIYLKTGVRQERTRKYSKTK